MVLVAEISHVGAMAARRGTSTLGVVPRSLIVLLPVLSSLP